jgi:hypothetical protein
MNTQTLTQNGITFTATIGEPQTVNQYGDKLPQVTDLTFNGETYNAGDIINVAANPNDWVSGQDEQHKIERINQTSDGSTIAIVGRTARGASDVFLPRKWNRISKQKFSKKEA